MINGKQFSIVFHVDNLKLSHNKKIKVVSSTISKLESIYAFIDPMAVQDRYIIIKE